MSPVTPRNHQATTVIAYLSAAGGPVRGILLLKHLSTSGNCEAESLSKTFGARAALDPCRRPQGKVSGVQSKKPIGKQCGKTEDEEDGVKCKKVSVDGGGKEVERGLEDSRRGRNVAVDGGSWRCAESKRGGTKRKAESKGNTWRKWPFRLNDVCVEDEKAARRLHQQQLHVFLCFTILLFGLCPKVAFSQVGNLTWL